MNSMIGLGLRDMGHDDYADRLRDTTRDLIAEHGGGYLAPLNDTGALTTKLVELASDRQTLAGLIAAAKQDGDPYDDEHVFKHRSDVIKENL